MKELDNWVIEQRDAKVAFANALRVYPESSLLYPGPTPSSLFFVFCTEFIVIKDGILTIV